MQVIEYLKEHGPVKLTQELSVVVKEYEEGLIVLNYNQIDSPKSHPIVNECRGLILDKQYNIVSRSFDRFFNLGEMPETQAHLDMSKATIKEKVDGSLIKIYHWNNKWHCSTRGTAFAESKSNGFDLTFAELVYRALCVDNEQEFNKVCDACLNKDTTYIFELTCMENRVVTRYEGYKLHYLAARHNITGEYFDSSKSIRLLGTYPIREYKFDSIEACVEAAKGLPNLEEGYVVYQDNIPVCKVKSPAYVAVHHIRGEGLNPKRICQLVLLNEVDEYLAYFPEDESYFTPYQNGLLNLLDKIITVWENAKHIETQKDFALAVKDYKFSNVLFEARKQNKDVVKSFYDQRDTWKVDILQEWK